MRAPLPARLPSRSPCLRNGRIPLFAQPASFMARFPAGCRMAKVLVLSRPEKKLPSVDTSFDPWFIACFLVLRAPAVRATPSRTWRAGLSFSGLLLGLAVGSAFLVGVFLPVVSPMLHLNASIRFTTLAGRVVASSFGAGCPACLERMSAMIVRASRSSNLSGSSSPVIRSMMFSANVTTWSGSYNSAS